MCYVVLLLSFHLDPSCDVKSCVSCSLPGKCQECEEGFVLEKEECVATATQRPSSSDDGNGAIIGKAGGFATWLIVDSLLYNF